MSTNSITLLYAIRHPFTDLFLSSVGEFVDITVEIKERFSGTLRVLADDVPEILVQGFANGSREIGFLSYGRVTWHIEPHIFGHDRVIDDRGRLHDVAKLEEA